MADREKRFWSIRKIKIGAIALAGILLVVLLVLGAFPVGILREAAEQRLSAAFAAPVEIAELTRDGFFSFTPEITVHNARIGQPDWVGKGHFVNVRRASARIPIFSLLTGNVTIRSLRVSGLELALVRDAEGNSNWAGPAEEQQSDGRNPLRLEQLTIDDSRFSLRDAKRRLDLSGHFSADGRRGLVVTASGTFNEAPARLTFTGNQLVEGDPEADWPFRAQLTSDLLALTVRGTMAGALNTRDMRVTMQARAPSLKQLDHLIEAGLFGTQEIDLVGTVRHRGEDWFIDSLEGTIGRSLIDAKGSVLKRDGRTLIDATINSPRFDFDDLADDAGQAEARAEEARIGPRVIPDTSIDLSKMGPTDGTIRFAIDRLLVKGGSAFRSFKGELSLERRVLRLDNAEVGLTSGRLTGWAKVDSTSETPILSTELRVEGTSLDTLIGDPDRISGPLRGLIRITGPGATIREAFANGDGKIAFVADQGSINRTAALVLGRDLGGAIVQELRDGNARASLRCAILSFEANDGVLRPAPLLIETEISSGRGSGQIDLDGEAVEIVINGATRRDAALELADPIRVAGALSQPYISIDDSALDDAASGGGVIRAIGRSIGNALGLRENEDSEPARSTGPSVNCRELAASALQ
jgi:uncharacterized protein involved in outer membrane biogenesis